MARRYGLHPSQVFAWRKAVRQGDVEQASFGLLDRAFTPVVVTGGTGMPPSGAPGCGRMEIVLISGRRIVIDATVEAAALSRIVSVLERQ